MLKEPRCFERNCKHFIGVKQDQDADGNFDEATERPVCAAFPDGIPQRIAYGSDLHLTPAPEQDNDIVFEDAGA